MYVTPRTLLGIIRISQAMAKLNFRNEVTMNDVDESLKLMDYSFRSLRRLAGKESDRRNARNEERRQDTQAEVMRAIRQICTINGDAEPITIHELYKRMQKQNSSLSNIEKDELKSILDYYHKLQVVYVSPDQEVMFI